MSVDTTVVWQRMRAMLQEYRQARPNLSLRSIARNAGVNRYFLTKLLEDSESSKFDLDQMLAFCRFMKQAETLQQTIKLQVDEIQKYLLKIFAYTTEQKSKEWIIVEKDEDLDLYDRNTFLVLLLASCDTGITKEKIILLLGESSKFILEQLQLNNKIIEKEDKTIGIPGGNPLWFSPSLIKHHFGDLVSFYDLRHRGQDRNYVYLIVQGLNQEGLKKAVEIQEEYAKTMEKLVTDKKYWGQNPFFAVACMDTFNDEVVP